MFYRSIRFTFQFGNSKENVLQGGNGRDYMFGFGGNDVIDGGAGNDRILGGLGADTLKGGAGSDLLYGGRGNDVLVYDFSLNSGATDQYDGGSRNDTLRLELDKDLWENSDFQTELAAFLEMTKASPMSAGWRPAKFTFESLGLSISRIEDIEIFVNGAEVSPEDDPVTLADDTVEISEDDNSVAGNVLTNDSVPDLVKTIVVDTGPGFGSVTLAEYGSFMFELDTGREAVQALAEGETLTDSFTYTVTDADGDNGTATALITITGENDLAEIAAIADTLLTETTDIADITGTIAVTFEDVDLNDTGHSATVVSTGTSGATAGLTLDTAALAALVTVTDVTKAAGSAAGTATLGFAAASTGFDYLAEGEPVTLSYQIAVDDGDGGIGTQTFDVVITGTSDGIAPFEASQVALDSDDRGFVINGVGAGDRSGFFVSSAGDVNGDGLDDVIIGARFDDPNGVESDAGFVVFGTMTRMARIPVPALSCLARRIAVRLSCRLSRAARAAL